MSVRRLVPAVLIAWLTLGVAAGSGGQVVPRPADTHLFGSVTISIDPPSAVVSLDQVFTMDVKTWARDTNVAGVVVQLDFDPVYLHVVDASGDETNHVMPGSTLPRVAVNRADNAEGHIHYEAATYPGGPPASGDFVLATIRLRAVSTTVPYETVLSFLPGCDVFDGKGDSVPSSTLSGIVCVVARPPTQLFLPAVLRRCMLGPVATYTPVPTRTSTAMPTLTQTPVPSLTSIPPSTSTATATATGTPTGTGTTTPTQTPTRTSTPSRTPTNTPTATATLTPSPTPTSTRQPTVTPTGLPPDQATWVLANRQPIISRWRMAVAYDAARQRLVMFGGCDAGGSPLADTWEYDGNHWVLVATAHSPAARWWHCAVYDDVRQRVVLFGGGDDVALFGDTWEYDGVDWSLTATAHSPPARWGASMVYDSDRRSAVLFGANGGLGDTWEYDGTDWRQVSTQWSPSGDSLISMAYDSTRRKTVLFGTGEQHDQTWEYDGTNWRQVTTPVSPMGRWAHAMAYHADRRRVVMFGGYGPSWPSGSALADTWEYDGSMWTQLSLSLFPAAREQHAMAYDSTRSVTVLFGGLASPGGVESDTWEFGPAGSPLPGVRRLEIRPNALYLQDGQITSTLHLHALDVYGSEVSVASHELRFRSLNPDVAEVSPHGVVTATGFGSAEITAMVDGNPAANQVRVQAGRFALRPAVLLLAASGPTTGTVVADVRNADGSILSRAGRTFSYFSTNPSVASVDSNGVVTALRPPRDFGETPYVTAVLEGVQSTNAALVRVTTDTLRLTMVPMEDRHVAFYLPQQAIQGFDYRAIFTTWDATRVTELAYQAMADLVGLRPFGGGIQFLVNDPGHGSDNTVPCGLTGNPVRLGTDIDRPVHNSCCIVAWGDGAPHFTVFFHETAHNFLDDNSRFGQFLRGSPNSNWAYSEGLASNVAARAALTLQTRQAEWIIPQRVLDYIMPIYHLLTTPDLDAYVANGARYEQLNPSVVYDLMLKGYQAAGPGFFRRFYAIFQPTYSALPGAPNSDREQATFFAAAVGAAANQDMRDRFKTQWGFPIVDAYYDTVYPQLLAAANQVW